MSRSGFKGMETSEKCLKKEVVKLCEVSGQLLIGGLSEQQLAIDYHLSDDRVIALSLWVGQFFTPPCVSVLP